MAKATSKVLFFVMFCLYPIIADAAGYENLIATKTVALWGIMIIVAVCSFVLGGNHLALKAKEAFRTKLYQIIATLLGVLIVSLWLTVLFSEYKLQTLLSEQGVLVHTAYILLFFLVSIWCEWDWDLSNYIAIAIAVNAGVATLQLGGYNPMNLYPTGYNYYDAGIEYSGVYLGTLGNTNVLSVWLVLSMVICIGAILCAEHRIQQIVGAFGCVAAAYTGIVAETVSFRIALPVIFLIVGFFVVSSCRALVQWVSALLLAAGGGTLGHAVLRAAKYGEDVLGFLIASYLLIVGGLAVLAMTDIIKKTLPKGKRNAARRWSAGWMGVAIGIGAAGVAAVYLLPEENLTGIWSEIHQILHGNVQASFGSSRILIWKETIASFSEKPILFGSGAPFSKFVEIIFARTTETGTELTTAVTDAHSVLLEWLHHNGVAGTVLAAMCIAFIIGNCLRCQSKAAKVCGAAIVSYIFISLFCVAGFFTDPAVWVLMGLALGDAQKSKQPAKGTRGSV